VSDQVPANVLEESSRQMDQHRKRLVWATSHQGLLSLPVPSQARTRQTDTIRQTASSASDFFIQIFKIAGLVTNSLDIRTNIQQSIYCNTLMNGHVVRVWYCRWLVYVLRPLAFIMSKCR